jgi:hypothetical protein
VAQVVERLLCKSEVLSLNPSPIKKKKNLKLKKKEWKGRQYLKLLQHSFMA